MRCRYAKTNCLRVDEIRKVHFVLESVCLSVCQLIDVENLEKTHAQLGTTTEEDFDTIFREMQGEAWSTKENYVQVAAFLESLAILHTSMYVGDIVRRYGKTWMCDSIGWVLLS